MFIDNLTIAGIFRISFLQVYIVPYYSDRSVTFN